VLRRSAVKPILNDWAASLGFKLPGGIEMPEDLDIKQATP